MSDDDDRQRSYGIRLFFASLVSTVVLAVVHVSVHTHFWAGAAISLLVAAVVYYVVVTRWCQRHPMLRP